MVTDEHFGRVKNVINQLLLDMENVHKATRVGKDEDRVFVGFDVSDMCFNLNLILDNDGMVVESFVRSVDGVNEINIDGMQALDGIIETSIEAVK